MKILLFIGDSLIEYFDWVGRFPGYTVLNLGISGETVEWLMERLPRITAEHPKADMVFIQSGINNIAMEDTGFIAEYREVIKRMKAAYPDARIYVTSLLPTLLPWLAAETIVVSNGHLRSLARETGTVYLDVHEEFMKGDLSTLLSVDGIHLSQRGYEVWSRVVEETITRDGQ